MKRIYYVVAILMIIAILTGCSNSIEGIFIYHN